MLEEAELLVNQLLEEQKPLELEFGAIYTGKILELRNTGVLLTLEDGKTVLIFPPQHHSDSPPSQMERCPAGSHKAS